MRACFSRPFDSIRTHTLLKFQAGARVERRKILAGARSPDGHRSRSRRRGTAGMRSRADAVAARQKRRRFCQGDRKRVAPPRMFRRPQWLLRVLDPASWNKGLRHARRRCAVPLWTRASGLMSDDDEDPEDVQESPVPPLLWDSSYRTSAFQSGVH